MQFERQMRLVKLYRGQMWNKSVVQNHKNVHPKTEVVRIVLQVVMQNYLIMQKHEVWKYLYWVYVKEGFQDYIYDMEQRVSL